LISTIFPGDANHRALASLGISSTKERTSSHDLDIYGSKFIRRSRSWKRGSSSSYDSATRSIRGVIGLQRIQLIPQILGMVSEEAQDGQQSGQAPILL